MTITRNDGGLYIEETIDGCHYGQFYKNMTEEQAIDRFNKMIKLFQAGQDLKVLAGDF